MFSGLSVIVVLEAFVSESTISVFITQVPPGITDQELRNLFAPYGNIVELHLVKKSQGAGQLTANL